MKFPTSIILAAFALVSVNSASAAIKAEYLLNDTLATSVGTAPSLVAVSPLGASIFVTDTVFGVSRTVYSTTSTGSGINQAGLELNTNGLVSSGTYSLEMIVNVVGGSSSYKRLFQTGTNDNGLYISGNTGSEKFSVYPPPSGNPGLPFSLNTYHHIVANVSANNVAIWLDGSLSQTIPTTILNITAPGGIVKFFIDDGSDYTVAKTALIRLRDTTLSNSEIFTLAGGSTPPPPVKYQVNITVKKPKFGRVMGVGSFNSGSTVTLIAKPKKGHKFVGWFDNKTLLSKGKKLVILNLAADRRIIAKFK
jgi:hypothetical protein